MSWIMAKRWQGMLIACLLAAVGSGCMQPKDQALQVYSLGHEKQILDSLGASESDDSILSGQNILNQVYAILTIKAHPKPDGLTLAAKTVAAICEEFQRQAKTELSVAHRQPLSAAVARTGRFEEVFSFLEARHSCDLDQRYLVDAGLAGMLSGSQPPAWLIGEDDVARIEQIILAREKPDVEKGFIGLGLMNWPAVDVWSGGPAWEAGLRTGDKVLLVDGSDVGSVRSVPEAQSLLSGPVGAKVVLIKVLRGNEEMEFCVQRFSRAAMSVEI